MSNRRASPTSEARGDVPVSETNMALLPDANAARASTKGVANTLAGGSASKASTRSSMTWGLSFASMSDSASMPLSAKISISSVLSSSFFGMLSLHSSTGARSETSVVWRANCSSSNGCCSRRSTAAGARGAELSACSVNSSASAWATALTTTSVSPAELPTWLRSQLRMEIARAERGRLVAAEDAMVSTSGSAGRSTNKLATPVTSVPATVATSSASSGCRSATEANSPSICATSSGAAALASASVCSWAMAAMAFASISACS
mmetsp:Transcript_117319/g.336570  ORF Transcript_117319/g.336570 Transcript_117319/m.336570 type:complete len:264 (+) Transcript_117319:275-1066(+)